MATAFAAAAALLLFGLAPANAAPGDPITVNEPALRACINAELAGHSPTDTITEADAGSVTEVSCSAEGVSDLTGAEHLTSVEKLYLDDNDISDTTPLQGLTSLERLHLKHNDVADLTPLGNVTSLQFLRLSDNGITDASPLANLTTLRQLNLSDNAITDASPLAGLGLLNLLDVSSNDITDPSPLAGLGTLTLRLGDNGITDVSGLSGLSNVRNLGLQDNEITDVSPLAAIASLRDLSLMRNHIVDLSPLGASPASVFAANQSVDLGQIVVGTSQPNPVINLDGTPANLDALYDAGSNTFTATTLGPDTLSWPGHISLEFTGTLSFTVVKAQDDNGNGNDGGATDPDESGESGTTRGGAVVDRSVETVADTRSVLPSVGGPPVGLLLAAGGALVGGALLMRRGSVLR